MWPQRPESKHEIPHTQAAEELVTTVDPATEKGLIELIHTYHAGLEAITSGDVTKEQQVGDFLIRSAVYGANRRERVLLGFPVG